jgi:hypothetical protein
MFTLVAVADPEGGSRGSGPLPPLSKFLDPSLSCLPIESYNNTHTSYTPPYIPCTLIGDVVVNDATTQPVGHT